MKIAIPERSISLAMDYTEKSKGFTHDHDGWKDQNRRSKPWRILFGKVAELCVIDFLKINGKNVTPDQTSHRLNDNYDFIFNLKKYDVKTSYTKNLPMCITRTYDRKPIDYFVFTRIDFYLQYLEIIGVVDRHNVVDPDYFVKYGESIPNNNKYTCSFHKGAYFYTGAYDDFFSHFGFINSSMSVEYFRLLYLKEREKRAS